MFQGELDAQSVASLMRAVSTALGNGSTDMHLVITSFGGSVEYAQAAYGFLKAAPVNLTTYNISTVQSAANMIFLAGRQRVASSAATFVLHPVTRSLAGKHNEHEIKDQLQLLSIGIKSTEAIYRNELKLSEAQYDELEHHNLILDAQGALIAGLVQRVAELTLPPGAAPVVITPSTRDF
jgi:ATP-dependent protease ClpP protease subunit